MLHICVGYLCTAVCICSHTIYVYVHINMYKRDFMIGSIIFNGLLTEKNNFSFMKVL